MIHIDPHAVAICDSFVMHRNVLAEGTLAASSEAEGEPGANALGPQTYDQWKPTSVPATLSVTLPAAVECDCAAIIAHNLGSKGATVEVQYHDGSSWVTAQSVTPEDDADLVLIFGGVEAAQWRIRVTGAVASIGVAMIGPRLLIPGGVVPDYVPVSRALQIELSPNISRKGQYLSTRVERVGAGAGIQFAPMERWWLDEDFAPFIAYYNLGKPFIWASCPDLLPDDGVYCWRAGETIRPSFGAGAQYASVALEVQAYVGS